MNKKKIIIILSIVFSIAIITAVTFVIIFNGGGRKLKRVKKVSAEIETTSSQSSAEESTTKDTSTQDETVDTETDSQEEGATGYVGKHTVVGTEKGEGYEGIEGTGKYNYGEALQKALIFYELQRCGELPETIRCNWRGDSCLKDGQDVSLDLTGGWVDAGDNVKFNLPMSYSASMLGWSIISDLDSYKDSGQLQYALANVKWANDYFIKCHPEDEVYYYQVGDGNQDHTFWGAVEVVENRMNRPSYSVTASAPGSTVTAQTAASLTIASIIFGNADEEYSKLCLAHARSLFDFSNKYRDDSGYTAANGFYNSWSGCYDELAWAGAWLYLATGEESYLDTAKECFTQASDDYKWAMCWDDVHIGAAILLSRITGDKVYSESVEKNLDFWTTGTDEGERITYSPKGLAWLDSWGALRYASTTAFIALEYTKNDSCPENKKATYESFAETQANYILGDTGYSYLIGFGDEYPVNPHHRTAQGSYADNMNTPNYERHTLYGALVGGPDASDNYKDVVSDYYANEVACDYNAGFVGLLAKMYGKYHGQTLINFGAVEQIDEPEYMVEVGINASGTDFIEVKAMAYNMTAWPARPAKNAELRYFIDLSEIYEAGGSASDIEVTTNYMKGASSDGIKIWDEENHIYYLSIKYDGNDFYPGGQEQYKKETQVRLKNPKGVWNNDNDPSFGGMQTGTLIPGEKLAFYEDGRLVYGKEPAKGDNAGESVSPGETPTKTDGDDSQAETEPQNDYNGTVSDGDITVGIQYSSTGTAANCIGGIMEITNNGKANISLKDLTINYYFTSDTNAENQFSCYHSAIMTAEGGYSAINGVDGSFKEVDYKDADTLCSINFSDNGTLDAGGKLTINFNINHIDWSAYNMNNDYSAKNIENIVIIKGTNVIFGVQP